MQTNIIVSDPQKLANPDKQTWTEYGLCFIDTASLRGVTLTPLNFVFSKILSISFSFKI